MLFGRGHQGVDGAGLRQVYLHRARPSAGHHRTLPVQPSHPARSFVDEPPTYGARREAQIRVNRRASRMAAPPESLLK